MTHLLRLDASSRLQGSHSRDLADFFQAQWIAADPEGQVTKRDVSHPAIPHVDELMIQGFQTPAANRTEEMKTAIALSDELLAELKAADYVLISVPMYNFSVPSALKAWVDQIVRIGETFGMEGEQFVGLLQTQAVFVCTAYGAAGYRNGGPMASLNFLDPFLQGLFSFLGVQDVHVFAAEGMMASPELQTQVKDTVKTEIQKAIATIF